MAEQAPQNPEDLDDVVAYVGYSTMHKLRSMIGYNRFPPPVLDRPVWSQLNSSSNETRLEESAIPVAPKDVGLSIVGKEVKVVIECGNTGSGITLKPFNLKCFSPISSLYLHLRSLSETWAKWIWISIGESCFRSCFDSQTLGA